MEHFYSDLALEQRESFPGDGGEIAGVSLKEKTRMKGKVRVTEVKILDERGARAMGKPMGTYLTIEIPSFEERTALDLKNCRKILSEEIEKMLPEDFSKIFAAGLGNAYLTADCLGPMTIKKLRMSCHRQDDALGLCGIAPGVSYQTGMETADILAGILEKQKVDCVIAIDALNARKASRLGTTIQISDTGICPGSGVGNHRSKLNEETMKVPVIAIGIPTVIRTGNFVSWEKNLESPELAGMYVMPSHMDEMVEELSSLLAESIHLVVYGKTLEGV